MFVEVGLRLRDERKRLRLLQEELAERLCVSTTSQSNYERGERSPDADYLAKAAKLGVDVQFVITGIRSTGYAGGPIELDGPATRLTADESHLVDNYRHASEEGRRALAATSAALAQPKAKLKPAA